MRPVLGAAAVCYLCVPLAYGAVSIVAKVRRFPSGYRPGPADIYNPLLSATDIASVRETLLAYASPDAVWYVTDPVSALDLPGRVIATAADFDTLESLRQARYVASRPLKIRALLPAVKFALDGKGRAIRDSFPQGGPWNSVAIPGSDYSLWTADLIAGH
jgi:hypothetical protein